MAKVNIPADLPGNSMTGRKSKRSAPIRDAEEVVEKEQESQAVEIKPVKRKAVRRATIKKRTLSQSLASAIAGRDGEDVMGYILNEVLIPAAKNTIQEMVQSGIEMFLYGERRSSRSRDRDRTSKISYSSYYSRSKDREERDYNRGSFRDKFNLSEIYFPSRSDAEDVLETLSDSLEEYDEVTVAEFFEAAGIDGATWAHDKYGWRELRRARIAHTRHGWQIIFPEPTQLD